MNKITAKLVAELAQLLGVELDLHYSDIQLALYNTYGVEAISRAYAALRSAGVEPPDVLQHVMLRATRGEQHLKTISWPQA